MDSKEGEIEIRYTFVIESAELLVDFDEKAGYLSVLTNEILLS